MLKLGLGLDLYRGAELDVPVAAVQLAERLGYHSVWTAEAYGADALSPLAFLAAHTSRIKLATGVVQIDARTPAATAMHAMTIDALAGGGRTIIGLGVSGPQVVEGWHGAAWGSPVAKLRDYVAIMRKVLARAGPVTHDGTAYQAALRRPGRAGSGQAAEVDPAPCARHRDLDRGRGTEQRCAGCGGGRRLAAHGLRVPGDRDLRRTAGPGPGPPRPQGSACGLRGVRVAVRSDHRRRGRLRWRLASRWSPCTWAGWGATPTTSTPRRWPAGDGPRPRPGSWSCGGPGAGMRRSRPFPTTTSNPSLFSARPDRIRARWSEAVPAGLTGVIVRCDRDEELALAAELAGTRDITVTGTQQAST